jgi:phosphate starvation-inducible protein PhoH
MDRNLRYIESTSGVDIKARGNKVSIEGDEPAVLTAEKVLRDLAGLVENGYALKFEDVKLAMRAHESHPDASIRDIFSEAIVAGPGKKQITAKTENQKRYVEAIRKHDIVFGIGPAGTGKTYLAMAMAVSALVNKEVNRIILTRPAVEAGEKLGFLPGDIYEKVHPYLRPLYDALYDMMDAHDRGRPARIHEGEDFKRLLHRPGRGAEHDLRADEDVPYSYGLQLEVRHNRRHNPGGPAVGQGVRPDRGNEDTRGGQRYRVHKVH